jgi:hypothetical protein
MVADVQRGTAVLADVSLDVEYQTAEGRLLGPGGTQGHLSLLGRVPPLILHRQQPTLAFIRSVVFFSPRRPPGWRG